MKRKRQESQGRGAMKKNGSKDDVLAASTSRSSLTQQEKEKAYDEQRSYKFQLHDLHKYSQNLAVKDTLWRFEKSVRGTLTPWDEAKMKRVQKAARFERAQEIMDKVDWAETPLYKAWEIEGPKWRVRDTGVYADAECK